MTTETHYEVLGVAQDATVEEITKAYRKIIRQYHPDVNPSPEAAEKSRIANVAKTILLDSSKREEYDKSLNPVLDEEVVVGDWEPTWGEEAGWGEEFDADVVEEDEEFTPPPFDENPNPIQNLPPFTFPEKLKDAPVVLKSRFKDAVLALVLSFLAPTLAILTQGSQVQLGSFAQFSAFVGVFIAFIAIRKWENKWLWSWDYQLGVFIIGYLALTMILSQLPQGEVARAIFPLLFGLAITSLVAPTFWSYLKQRKILKPKLLRKNNSFGSLNGTSEEQLIEDSINPLWDVKGLRVFRVWHPSFTHVVIFGNKAVALKGIILRNDGVLQWSGPVLLNRYGPYNFEKVLDESYQHHLLKFFSHLPKNVEVFPMVAAFPAGSLKSFVGNDKATIVAGEDLTSIIAKVLFEDASNNVVNHELITNLYVAANRK